MDSRSREEFLRACALIDQNCFSEARPTLERLASLYPSEEAPHLKLGYVCWKTRDFTLAIASFRRAVEIDPRSEMNSLALFHCLTEAGNELDATSEIRRFMSLSDSADYREIIADLHKRYLPERYFPDGRPRSPKKEK